MEIQEKTKMILDIEKLLIIGVTKQAIASSMLMSRQAFHQRFNAQKFTVDQVHLFYRKYGTMV